MALKMKLGRLTGPLNCCQWCDFSTRSWSLFEQHLNRCQRRTEQVNAKAATTEASKKNDFLKCKRNYRCDSCDFHAARPKPLLLHVKEAHQPNLEIFSCELCNYASRFKAKVSQHKRLFHSVQAPDDAIDSVSRDEPPLSGTVRDVHEGTENKVATSTKAERVVSAKPSGKKRKHPESKVSSDKAEEHKKSIKRHKSGKEVPPSDTSSVTIADSDHASDSAGHSSKVSMPPLLNANKPSAVKVLKPKSWGKEGAKGKGMPNGSVDSSKLIIKDVSVKSANSRIIRYKCQLCSFLHSRRESIVKHLRSVHGKKVGHSCPKCDFVAKSKAKLASHILNHNKRRYRCPDCSFKTLTKHRFLEHRACHVISGLYACHRCSFSSNTESSVITHRTDHHDKSEPRDNKNSGSDTCPPILVKYTDDQSSVGKTSSEIQCDFCDSLFASRSEVSEHVLAVHPGAGVVHKCSVCSLVYKCRRYLNAHMKQKHGITVADHQQLNPKDQMDESVSVLDAAAAATDAISDLLPKLEKVLVASDSEVTKNEDRKTSKARSEKVRKLSLSKSNHLKGTDLQRKKDPAKGIVSGDWNAVKKHEEDSNSKEDSSGACAADDTNSTGVGGPGNKMQNLPEIAVLSEGSRTIFYCVKCSTRHTNKVSLESHLSRGHPGSILYHCPLCKYGALWRLSMKNHLKNHRKEAKTLEGLRTMLEQSFRLESVGISSLSSQQDTATQDPARIIVPAENGLDMPVPSQDGVMFKMPKSSSVVKSKKEWKSKAPCVKEEPRVQIKTEVVDVDDVDDADIKCADKQLPVNKTKPGITVSKTKPGITMNKTKPGRWFCTDCNTDCKNAVKLARHKERHANLKRFMCSECGVRSNYDFYIRNHIQKNHWQDTATMQILPLDEAKRTIAKYPKRGQSQSPSPKADKTKIGFGQKAKGDKTKLSFGLKTKAEKAEINFNQTPKVDKSKLNCSLKPKAENTDINFGQMLKAESSGMSTANIDHHPEESKDFLTASGTRISLCKIKTEPEDKKPDVRVVVRSTGKNRRKYLKWLCDQCTFASDSPAKLTSHKEVHENLKRFLCPVCGVRSNWILYVQGHIRKAHRSAKVSVVELSREEARRTLPEYLKQCKGSSYSPSKAKKSQVKPKSSKSKDNTRLQDSKTIQQSNKNILTNEPEPSSVGQNSSESLSRKSSKRSLFDQCLDGSVEMFSAGVSVSTNLNLTKSPDADELPASAILSSSKVCIYKKFKCSVCGMRSNWSASLRKHRQLLHPHAKAITLSISDAKASLAFYESELKPVIAASNLKTALAVRINLQKPKALKRLRPSKKNQLKKLKMNSGLAVYGCSQCSYKTKYRWNAKKHVAGVHPTAEIHKIDNSCVESLDSSRPDEKNSKVYSCSECGLHSELLVAMKKHIGNVHSSASILRLSLSNPSLFPNPHVSPSGLRTTSEPIQESPIAVAVTNIINSFEKGVKNSSEPCTGSPIASAEKYDRPMNFACSGCNRRMDRRKHIVRHIRSAHPNEDCHVIHMRRYRRNRFLSKQSQIESTDCRREVEKSASINADGGFEWPESVQDGSDGTQRCLKILDCDICPYRAPRHNQLLRHKKLHEERPGYTFECTFCPYFCPSSSCLQRHLQLHATTASVIPSSTSHPLEDHAYSQSPPPVNGRGEYSCDKCPFMSESCQRFVYHKQFHRPRPAAAFRCDVCPFWVPESKMMVQHAKLHERFSLQLAQQTDESHILDDVVETARIKWDVIAAKCVPANTGVQCAAGSVSGEARSTDNNSEGRVPRRRSSSPRSQLAQKSFTEMWLSGSLVGSEHASVHEENSSDTLETSSSLASKNTGDDISKNGAQLKDNESDFGRANVAGEFELPATRSWHCEKCPYLTVTVVHFKRHMSLHGSQQRYECQFCDYSVPRYFLLLQHKKLHLAPNRNLLFSQPISSLQCISQLDNNGGSEQLLKEITFVPSENEPTFFEDTPDFRLPSKLFRCGECPYSTIRHKVLVTHQKHHTVRATYACPFCSYSVSDQRRLNQHVVEHFNLPGSEMSAYSASESPDLMEAMKAEIVRISGRSMGCPVSAKVADDQPHLAGITEDGGHGLSEGTCPVVPGGDLQVGRNMVADSNMLNPGRYDSSTSDTGRSMLDGNNTLASSIDIIDDDSTLVAGERIMDGDDRLNNDCKIFRSKSVRNKEKDFENLILPKDAPTERQPREANPGNAKSSSHGSRTLEEELQPELDFQIVRNADYDEDRETSDADSVYQAVICKSDDRMRSDEEQQHGELTDGENITVIEDKGKLLLSSDDNDANRFPNGGGIQYEPVNPVCIIDSPIPDSEFAGHQAIVETFAIFKVEATSLEPMNGSATALVESTGEGLPGAEEDDVLFISESESEMESGNRAVEKDASCTEQNLRAEKTAEEIGVPPKLDACEERDESTVEDDWHVTVNDEEDLYIELSPEPEEIDEQSLDFCADVDRRICEEKESDFKQSQLTLTPGENPS